MEIHELNTYGGTLGAGDFFATDNGNDTSKVSAESMFAPLNARIDNIIAGPAPSAQEVTDARLGADGVTYTSLGLANRTQFDVVKEKIDLINLFDPDTANYGWLYAWSKNAVVRYTGSDFGQTAPIKVQEGEKIIIWNVTAGTGTYGIIRLGSNDINDTISGITAHPTSRFGGSYYEYEVPANTPYITIPFITTRQYNVVILRNFEEKIEGIADLVDKVASLLVNLFDSASATFGWLYYISQGQVLKAYANDFGQTAPIKVSAGDVVNIYSATENTGTFAVVHLNSADINDTNGGKSLTPLKAIDGKSYARYVIPTGVEYITVAFITTFMSTLKIYIADKVAFLPNIEVNALGDSITEGFISTNNWANPRWTDIAASSLGCVVNNYGVSGTSICDGSSESFVTRLNRMTQTWIDCLVIFGGTNDYGDGRARTLGSIADEPAQGTNFYASFKNLVLAAINKYPMAQVLIVTPMRRASGDPNAYGISIEDIVDAEIEVAKYYGVKCFDFYHEGGINPAINIQKNAYTSDGLHPNQDGVNLFVAPNITKAIESCVACR